MREEVLYEIFIDLHKAYDTLDRDICLEILEGYIVVPQAHRILREYWNRLWMVACTGGYYGVAFKGFQGVTQGYPLYPTIFNVVVYAVVLHWASLAKERAGGKDGCRREGCHRGTFLIPMMVWLHK